MLRSFRTLVFAGLSRDRFAVVVLCLALVGGVYFAGFSTLKLLGLQTPLQFGTYWQYWQALDLPQVAPWVTKIKLAGAIGLGLPLLAWLLLLVPLLRAGQEESLHGDARLADLSDLKKAGLLEKTPESIIVGKYRDRYLYINGALHVITVAPTRSGKTTSIAIPVLLSYEQSMVVLDLKGNPHSQDKNSVPSKLVACKTNYLLCATDMRRCHRAFSRSVAQACPGCATHSFDFQWLGGLLNEALRPTTYACSSDAAAGVR